MRIYILIAVGALLIVTMALTFRVKILTLERDQEISARVVAEGVAKAAQRQRVLIAAALEKARKEDHDRIVFTEKQKARISADRGTGRDGPLAPVLRDTLEQLQRRSQTAP